MAPCGPVSSRQRISRSISGASTRRVGRDGRAAAAAGPRRRAGRRRPRRSRSPAAVGAPRDHRPAGSSSSSGAMAAGRSASPTASAGTCGLASMKWPVTGQVGGDQQALPGPVLEDLVAEQQALAALGHDDQQRLGQRVSSGSTVSTFDSSSPSTGVRRSGRAWAAMRPRISSSRPGMVRTLQLHHRRDRSGQCDQGDIEQDRARASAYWSTADPPGRASMESDQLPTLLGGARSCRSITTSPSAARGCGSARSRSAR